MNGLLKFEFAGRRKASPDRALDALAMSGALDLSTVPAAWPTGVSQLAQAVDACQQCDTGGVCADRLNRAPEGLSVPAEFCPEAATFGSAKPN